MLTDASLATDLPRNLGLSDLAATTGQTGRNLIGSDSVDPVRLKWVYDALAATASGGRDTGRHDRGSANDHRNGHGACPFVNTSYGFGEVVQH